MGNLFRLNEVLLYGVKISAGFYRKAFFSFYILKIQRIFDNKREIITKPLVKGVEFS